MSNLPNAAEVGATDFAIWAKNGGRLELMNTDESSAGRTEHAALVALSLAALLGTIGLGSATLSSIALLIGAVGLTLLWLSSAWNTTDKVIGTMILPIGFWVIELIHYAHRTAAQASELIVLIDRALIAFIVVTDVMVSVGALAYLVVRLQREAQTSAAIKSRT